MLRMRVRLPDFRAVHPRAQNLGHNQTEVRSTHIYVIFLLKRCHCLHIAHQAGSKLLPSFGTVATLNATQLRLHSRKNGAGALGRPSSL